VVPRVAKIDLTAERRTSVAGDDAFHLLEEELDLADRNRSG
jgi:hypothetical protein